MGSLSAKREENSAIAFDHSVRDASKPERGYVSEPTRLSTPNPETESTIGAEDK